MFQAIKAKYIITPDQSFLTNSSVIINNNIISGIIPNYQLTRKEYKVIDLKNSVLLPGFINSHVHLELHWTQKLLNPFNSFPDWLNQIISLKRNFDNSKISNSVKKGLDESLNSGVTTIGEISSYEGLDYKAIIKSGIRTAYFYEIANSTILNIESKFLKGLLQNTNSLFNLRIFPHSIYSLDTKSLKKVLAFAKKHNTQLGIHLSESVDEINYAMKKKNNLEDKVFSKFNSKPKFDSRPSTPLEYLDRINLFRQIITLVHMNNLSSEDLKILKKRQYPVVICPRSNLYLNQKLPNLRFFMNYKKTGLGTDGLSSNISINFLDEINFLYLNAKKILINNPERRILEIATLGGAKALGLDSSIGTIEKNKKADLIAFNLKNKDPYLSVMHSNSGDLKMSMIDGKIIKLK